MYFKVNPKKFKALWPYHSAYVNPKNGSKRLVFVHSYLPRTYLVWKKIGEAEFVHTVKYVRGSRTVEVLMSHWNTNVPFEATESEIKEAYDDALYFLPKPKNVR